jgi:small subunit ribosomal protein S20
MPNTKSAEKRMRTSEIKRQANRSVKGRIATIRRRFSETLESGDKAKSEQHFRQYCACLDKAVKKGVVKANTADRSKSRAAIRLASL